MAMLMVMLMVNLAKCDANGDISLYLVERLSKEKEMCLLTNHYLISS